MNAVRRHVGLSVRRFTCEKGVLGHPARHQSVWPKPPMTFQQELACRAKESKKRIVLPEGDDIRVVEAACLIQREGLADVIVLGSPDNIYHTAKANRLDLRGVELIDPARSKEADAYAEMLYEVRKAKGMTEDEAARLVKEDWPYYGTMMVRAGAADGMVSGSRHTSAETIKPALQIIGLQEGRKTASSIFFMLLPSQVFIFADCALHVRPSSEELAHIAAASVETAKSFGIVPDVALLSYATGDSNDGPMVRLVRRAVTKAKKLIDCSVNVTGPMQFDAAVSPEVAKAKGCAESGGHSNVLVFPDLNAGNITYKAVQQATGCIAIGPVLQGLRKPVNDLSRGCTVPDIVNTAVVTALQAA